MPSLTLAATTELMAYLKYAPSDAPDYGARLATLRADVTKAAESDRAASAAAKAASSMEVTRF